MKKPVIEVKKLSKKYNNKHSSTSSYALQEVNLQVVKGDVYGIIGMSGAGKSTLMRCLIGLEKPCTGSILLNGEDIAFKDEAEWRLIRREIGMVFQHFQLFTSRTVAQNIAYPLEIYGLSKEKQQKRVDELLSLVGLEKRKDAYPAQLSGGEKQRVGIARALANHPQILFCDEPTSALDPHTTRSFLQLLLQLNRTLDLTIVVITHQLDLIKQICNRVAVLSNGDVVEEKEVRELFSRPTHEATRHLLHWGRDQIPEGWLACKHGKRLLVRLGFEGQQAKEPVLSQMIKRFAVDANILSGGLDYLQNAIIGNLIVELSGSVEELQAALNFLRTEQINCEVLR